MVGLVTPRTLGPGDRLSIIKSTSGTPIQVAILHKLYAECPCPLLPIEIFAMLKILMHRQPL